jgi:hypothetical protein
LSDFSPLIPPIISGACGFFGAWLAFRYNWRLERGRRHAAVLAAAFSAREKFRKCKNIETAHAESLDSIREAVAMNIGFLKEGAASNLLEAWERYRDIRGELIRDTEGERFRRTYRKIVEGKSPPEPSEVVERLLRDVEEIIRKS